MLNTAPLLCGCQTAKLKIMSQSENIVPNVMPLPVYIDRHHCYNKEVVSVGTHLKFYYSSFPFLFSFLLTAGGKILRPHTCPLVCICVIRLVIKQLGIQKSN
jgi:hypothetical protein